MFKINSEIINLQNQLSSHPIYDSIHTINDLRCFTEHHIYSVWDFMSLVKCLQDHIAPSTYPWFPRFNGELRRFINEIIIEEESDQSIDSYEYLSHFEIYQKAMAEIGADSSESITFIENVRESGIKNAFKSSIPLPAKDFMEKTFDFINTNKIHMIASAFTFGRETLVPKMFKSIVEKLNINNNECPTFYYYMNRHIEVDDEKHGPMALNLLHYICGDNKSIIGEVLEIAKDSLVARINFWDGVHNAILINSKKEVDCEISARLVE